MGIVARFERKLQGAVGDVFARVFGGAVVPREVEQALEREIADGVRHLGGGHSLVPNHYTVTLSSGDHSRLLSQDGGADQRRVADELARSATRHIAASGWQTYGDVVIDLVATPSLHTGQFRIRSTVDPDAARSGAAVQNHAGATPMSHSNGDNQYRDDQYRDDRYRDDRYPDPGPESRPREYAPPNRGYSPPPPGGSGPGPGASQSPYERRDEGGYGGEPGYYDGGYAERGAPAQYPQQDYGRQNYSQQNYDQPGYAGQQDYGRQNYGQQNYESRDLVATLHLDDGSGPDLPAQVGQHRDRAGPGGAVPVGRHRGLTPAPGDLLGRAGGHARRSRLDQRHHGERRAGAELAAGRR